MDNNIHICTAHESGKRIDLILADHFHLSRTYIQGAIKSGRVKRNNIVVTKPGIIAIEGDSFTIDPEKNTPLTTEGSIKGLTILFENEDFIVIDKPAGVASQKASGRDEAFTIADWAQQKHQNDTLDRNGLVHRIDKDTSGLMLIAKEKCAQKTLGALFEKRQIKKEYIAFVIGAPKEAGEISYNIVRDPANPTKMTYSFSQGKEAYTSYTLLSKHKDFSVLLCKPTTGRTHQIRVHLAAIECPILGDATYGHRSSLISRHALHAHTLSFSLKEKEFSFQSPLAEDMQSLLL